VWDSQDVILAIFAKVYFLSSHLDAERRWASKLIRKEVDTPTPNVA